MNADRIALMAALDYSDKLEADLKSLRREYSELLRTNTILRGRMRHIHRNSDTSEPEPCTIKQMSPQDEAEARPEES